MTRTLRYTAAAGATLALMMVACAVALAATSATSKKVLTSRTFAGYEIAEAKTDIKSASVTFVVPTITCHQNFSGVGPSVIIASTVVKHTYSDSGGAIAVVCQNKTPTYVALPIVDGTDFNDDNVAIAAGDKIKINVLYAKTTKVTLTDETTNQVDTHTGKKSTGENAYFGDSGVQINHKGIGLDPFTKTSFSAATINGHALGSKKPQRYEWVDSKKVVLVTASKITHKDDFTTSFKRSS